MTELVDLFIVMIAIPNLLKSRQAANESSGQ